MFNKFKIGEFVLCLGVGKVSEKRMLKYGIIIEKDYYYKDYCIRFENDKEEWFSEKDIIKIVKNGGSRN